MGLLDLPVEILDIIISLTLPSGIETFALCCKAINARAASQIHKHNILKSKWKHTVARRGNILSILYEISRDPLVAQYIESLNLWDRDRLHRDPHHSLPPRDFDEFRADEEAMKNIKKLVTSSVYLEAAGVDADDWWQKMMEDEEKDIDYENPLYAAVLLLSQLPNLKRLQLPHRWHDVRTYDGTGNDDGGLVSVLNTIVKRSNSGMGHDKPLGKLETILPFMLEGYEQRAGLRCVQPFLPLKSMRNLYAVSCLAVDDGYTGIPFRWHFQELFSPLRRIELAYCCMDADGISELLSHTPFLTVFKYSHQTKWHACEYDWNPGAFNEAVARHCGQTITELAITIDEAYGNVRNGVSSFHSYPNLQALEVDVRIFCGPPVESGQELGMSGELPEGEEPWEEEDIPCLGSMLPPSITEVQLNTDYPRPDQIALNVLLKNAREERQSRLTKLHKFIIRQYNGDNARAVAERAGVTLDVFSQEGGPRSMMPAWKREFEEQVGGLEFT